MTEGCEHGPAFKTGTPCPKCEEEGKTNLPSIQELEAILENEGIGSIEMLPNGEIRAKIPMTHQTT